MAIFNHRQAEEFLEFVKNFKKENDGVRTTKVTGRMNYLLTILCGETMRKFDKLTIKKNGITDANLNATQ